MNPLETPMYSSAMAARLVDLTPWRVRRWLKGYDYSYLTGSEKEIHYSHSDPLIRSAKDSGSTYASFLELIDLVKKASELFSVTAMTDLL